MQRDRVKTFGPTLDHLNGSDGPRLTLEKSAPRKQRTLRKLQFTVDSDTVEKLAESNQLNRDPSLVQTFRRAAAMLVFLDRALRDGYELALTRGHETVRVVMP